MIYIDNHSTDANFNFALEKYAMYELDIAQEYFIFWRTSPTLMIGKYQNPYQEINMNYSKQNDVNVVRRITGGGTIYTDMNGWQFSFIVQNPSTNKIEFSKYTKPIINALDNIGVVAYQSGRNDLLIDGKKFSGNAQFHDNKVSLHHGSILFDTDLEALVRALNVEDEKIISKGIKSVRERVTNVADYLPKKISSIEFRDVMLKFLLEGMETYTLTKKDMKRVNEIKQEQFDTWEWNMGKTPKFNRTKEKRLAGGKLNVCSYVEKGVIKDIQFYGDFFASRNIEDLRDVLCEANYEKDSIKNKLIEVKADTFFYEIKLNEILELII